MCNFSSSEHVLYDIPLTARIDSNVYMLNICLEHQMHQQKNRGRVPPSDWLAKNWRKEAGSRIHIFYTPVVLIKKFMEPVYPMIFLGQYVYLNSIFFNGLHTVLWLVSFNKFYCIGIFKTYLIYLYINSEGFKN